MDDYGYTIDHQLVSSRLLCRQPRDSHLLLEISRHINKEGFVHFTIYEKRWLTADNNILKISFLLNMITHFYASTVTYWKLMHFIDDI